MSHDKENSDLEPSWVVNHRVRHTAWDLLLISEKITRDTTTALFVFHITSVIVSLKLCLVPGSRVVVWEGIS